MNKSKAVEIIQEYIQDNARMLSFDEHTAFSIAIAELSYYEHDGCCGCAFEGVEEWEMPCVKCKNACKDYYRRPAKEGVE